jgi:hypothetical protein
MYQMPENVDKDQNDNHPDEPRGPRLAAWEEAEIEEMRRRGAFKGPMKIPTVMEPL